MASNVGKRVGKRIRELRVSAGLSQAKLAERLGSGVAVETVSRFERGAQVPSFEWVERIAIALGTDIDGFLTEFSTAAPPPRAELDRILALLRPLSDDELTHVRALLRAHLNAVEGAVSAALRRPDAG